jgi:hypothetical protein
MNLNKDMWAAGSKHALRDIACFVKEMNVNRSKSLILKLERMYHEQKLRCISFD